MNEKAQTHKCIGFIRPLWIRIAELGTSNAGVHWVTGVYRQIMAHRGDLEPQAVWNLRKTSNNGRFHQGNQISGVINEMLTQEE